MFLLEIKGEWVFTMDIPLCRGNLVPGKALKVYPTQNANDVIRYLIVSFENKILIADSKEGIAKDPAILSQYEGCSAYIEELSGSCGGSTYRFIIAKNTDVFKPIVQAIIIEKKEPEIVDAIRGDE